ncbi:hypothetical protein M408DRAFT_31004 [Serendipita vermifera MAFF 305830]|uniref:Uncharacterized protein n=1 Tax=Serendipita vermifera MAFF 305830 TaxID=933852 RepID=A0A0C3AK73_SERVB|nr:hypothetical protein M408DRAFT_31004 [Serendipita vermifera MAFF 305830]
MAFLLSIYSSDSRLVLQKHLDNTEQQFTTSLWGGNNKLARFLGFGLVDTSSVSPPEDHGACRRAQDSLTTAGTDVAADDVAPPHSASIALPHLIQPILILLHAIRVILLLKVAGMTLLTHEQLLLQALRDLDPAITLVF